MLQIGKKLYFVRTVIIRKFTRKKESYFLVSLRKKTISINTVVIKLNQPELEIIPKIETNLPLFLQRMQETTIETKNCKKCGISFEISESDLAFYDKISPIFNWKKYNIPSPTLCNDCREQKAMTWRNERKLYRRKCDLTGKSIISIFSEDKPFKVYDNDEWWSDKWNPMDYAQEVDFDKSFFQQLNQLRIQVPRAANNTYPKLENTLYCNLVWNMKWCYMCNNCWDCEDCLYSHETFFSQDCIDCFYIKNCKLCYECYDCNQCSHTFFSQSCQDCSFSHYSYNCTGCNNIFLCNNLKNKKYCIKNKQYSPEEYKQEIDKLLDGNYNSSQELQKKLIAFKLHCAQALNSNIKTENCIWDYLTECKNCENTFIAYKSENCKNILSADANVSNCQDMLYLAESEYCYNGIMVTGYKQLFSYLVVHGSNNLYCDLCTNCEYCFGCIWLQNKKYCILNKQYSKEEYENIVPLLIEKMKKDKEWGEFFPQEHSIFDYNESIAIENFPLTKSEAIKHWFQWTDKEYPINIPEGMARIEAQDLPELDSLDENIEKKILNTAIICKESRKPFRIIKPELEFYKKYKIPLPRKHHDIRHTARSKFRNPRKFYDRKCDKCGVEIKTTYSPNRPETIYCKTCYTKEFY